MELLVHKHWRRLGCCAFLSMPRTTISCAHVLMWFEPYTFIRPRLTVPRDTLHVAFNRNFPGSCREEETKILNLELTKCYVGLNYSYRFGSESLKQTFYSNKRTMITVIQYKKNYVIKYIQYPKSFLKITIRQLSKHKLINPTQQKFYWLRRGSFMHGHHWYVKVQKSFLYNARPILFWELAWLAGS